MLSHSSAYSVLNVKATQGQIPTRYTLHTSRAQVLGLSLLLVPGLLIAAAVPTTFIYLALKHGSLSETILAEPMISAQLVAAALLAAAIIYPAVRSLIWQVGRRVDVCIEDGHVRVDEHHALGTKRWNAATSEFVGLLRQTVATSGGFVQHLILVHPMPERSVLLHIDNVIDQDFIDQFATSLGLSEIGNTDFDGNLASFLSFRSSLKPTLPTAVSRVTQQTEAGASNRAA